MEISARCHIGGISSLFQRFRFCLGCKLEKSVITVFVRCPVAAEIDSRCNPSCIQIRIVRRRTIRRPVIHLFRILHAVHIVYVIRFEQRNRIRRLSIVVIQSVKSRCQIHIIFAAAPHRSDLFEIIIVFKQPHQARNAAFDRRFIDHSRTADTALRAGADDIAQHDRHRAPSSLYFGDRFSCQITFHHTFRQRILRGCRLNRFRNQRLRCRIFGRDRWFRSFRFCLAFPCCLF